MVQAALSERSQLAGVRPSQAQRTEIIQAALQQIAHALAIFGSTSDLPDDRAADSMAPLHVRLPSQARDVEAAMHRLRDLDLMHGPAATELSQSLTVLVLVADMITSGQLTDLATGRALLRRNAYRASGCLYELREQLLPAA